MLLPCKCSHSVQHNWTGFATAENENEKEIGLTQPRFPEERRSAPANKLAGATLLLRRIRTIWRWTASSRPAACSKR